MLSRSIEPHMTGLPVLHPPIWQCIASASWGLSFCIPMSLLSLQVREHLVRQYEKRVAAGYEWTEGEVEWTPRNTIVYPLICSMAGAALIPCYVPPWHAYHKREP